MEIVSVEDSITLSSSPRYAIVRDKFSEINMVMQLAAETIQDAFRRYKACKPAIKLRRVNSYESLVVNMAADTIKSSFKRLLTKVSRKRYLSSSSKTDISPAAEPIAESKAPEEPVPLRFSFNPNRVRVLIRNVETNELPNINWNGRNDVYVKLTIGEWSYLTPVRHGAGAKAVYKDINIERVFEVSDDRKEFESLVMKVEVMNKNLARNDQLIGEGEFSLAELTIVEPEKPKETEDETETIKSAPAWFADDSADPKPVQQLSGQDLTVDLYSPKSLSQSRYRGNVHFRILTEFAVAYVPEEVHMVEFEETIIEPALGNEAGESVAFISTVEEKQHEYLIDKATGSNVVAQPVGTSSTPILKAVQPENTLPQLNKPGTIVKSNSGRLAIAPMQKTSSGRSLGSAANSATSAVAQVPNRLSVASAQLVTSSSASKIQGSGSPPLPDTYRVIDEAFAAGMRCECSIIELSFDEAVQVVDALGYTIDYSAAAFAVSTPLPALQLPMLSNAPLAAVLTKFIKDYQICSSAVSPSFVVTEDIADIAVKNLRALAEGTWLKARFLILVACNRTDQGSGRPSNWLPKWISRLMKILQLPTELTNECSGRDFIDITKEDLEQRQPGLPAILKFRFLVYQHTLRLLEQWWDRGFRPNDHYTNSSGIKAGMTFAAGKGTSLKSGSTKGASGTAANFVKGRWSPLDRTANQDLMSHRLRWGVLDEDIYNNRNDELLSSMVPSRSQTLHAQRIFVEIANFNALLQAWVPLNRAYGWGISMETLSAIANKFASSVGYLTFIDERNIPSPEALASINIRDCRWVAFASDDANPAPGVDYMELIDILRFQRKSCAIVQESISGEDALLVPLGCLRSIESHRKQSILAIFASRQPTLADERPDTIKLGLPVRVANDLTLSRACERFNWWDRPPQEILLKLAGRKGELVSVGELLSKQRVGVRVTCEDVEVVDALPLEALYSLQASQDKQSSEKLVESAVAEKASKIRKKRKSTISKRRKLKNDVALAETIVRDDHDELNDDDNQGENSKNEADSPPNLGYLTAKSLDSGLSISPLHVSVPLPTASDPTRAVPLDDSEDDRSTNQVVAENAGNVLKDSRPPPKSPQRSIFRPGSSALKKLQQPDKVSDTMRASPEPMIFDDVEYSWLRGIANRVKPVATSIAAANPNNAVSAGNVTKPTRTQEVIETSDSKRAGNGTSVAIKLSTPEFEGETLDYRSPAEPEYDRPHVKHSKKAPSKQPWKPSAVTVDTTINTGHTSNTGNERNVDVVNSFPGLAITGLTPGNEGLDAHRENEILQHIGPINSPPKKLTRGKPARKSVRAWDDTMDKIAPVPDMEDEFGIMFDPPIAVPAQDRPNSKQNLSRRPVSAAANKKSAKSQEPVLSDQAVLDFGLNFQPPDVMQSDGGKQKEAKVSSDSGKSKAKLRATKPQEVDPASVVKGIDFQPPVLDSTYKTAIIPPARPKSATSSRRSSSPNKEVLVPLTAENDNINAKTVDANGSSAPETAYSQEQKRLLRREQQRLDKDMAAHSDVINTNLRQMRAGRVVV